MTLSDVRLSAHTLTPCAACTAPRLTLSFRVSRLSVVHVTLQRLTAHGWRQVGVRDIAELGGRHRSGFGESFNGHRLNAGRYRLLLIAANGPARFEGFVEALRVTAVREDSAPSIG